MRRSGLFLFSCLLLLVVMHPAVTTATDPCGLSFTPLFFYTGFDNGNTGGFVTQPPGAWGAGNNNTAYEVQDTGCSTWGRAAILTGYQWADVLLGTSCQFKEGESCACAGLMYRYHWTSGQPQLQQFYQFVLENGNTAALMRYNGTTFDRVETVPYSYSADRWYTMRVRAVGPNHTAYVNGVPVISWTDPSYLSGTGGPVALGTRAWFDNVTCLMVTNPLLLAQNPSHPSGSDEH